MQLRDRAQGAGTDVHGAEGDQGRQEVDNIFSWSEIEVDS